jgi:hypothetical protein
MITLATSNPAVLSVPISLTVASGATTANLAVQPGVVSVPTKVSLTAVCGSTAQTVAIDVLPLPVSLSYMTLYPTELSGGTISTLNRVYLSAPMPPSGGVVKLSSSRPDVATVDSAINVPGGAAMVSFRIRTIPVGVPVDVTISATVGAVTKSLMLRVVPPRVSYVTLYPTTVPGGTSSTLNRAYLTGPLPATGIGPSITTSRPEIAAVKVGSVAAGATVVQFTITTQSVDTAVDVVISVALGGATQTANLKIVPARLSYFTVYPQTIPGGTVSTLNRVYLEGVAPASGTTVSLSSSRPDLATVPATVKIDAGSTVGGFQIKTAPVPLAVGVTISVTVGGVTKTTSVTVRPAALSYFTLYPQSLSSGQVSSLNRVYLDAPAPAGGTIVNLSSSNPHLAQVPPTVTIGEGSSVGAFQIKASVVSTSVPVGISVSAGGVTRSASVTIIP